MTNTTSGQYPTAFLLRRLLAEHIRPHAKMIFMALFCMIVVASTTALNAWIMQPILDDIFLNRNGQMLKLVPLAVLLITIAKGAGMYGQSFLIKCLGQRVVTEMQVKLYKHLINSDISLLSEESSGRLVSRFTNDINVLRYSVSNIMVGFAKEALTIVFLVGLMFYQNFTLSAIAFAAFPVAIYPAMRLGKRMRKVSNKTQEELGEFTAQLDETFQAVRVIKAYQREGFEINRAATIIERLFGFYKKAARTEAASSPIMETLGGIAVASVVWYGGAKVIDGTTTPGAFFSFIAALLMAYKPMKSLSGFGTSLQEGLAAANRLFKLLDIHPAIVDKKDAVKLAVTKDSGNIEFSKVKFSYNTEKSALKGVSFTVPVGKKVALVGPSGGGKSTIMNLILRFYDANSGYIKIDGIDIRDVTLSSLRDSIAFVSQDTVLFDDTIAANISYGKIGASIEEIKASAIAAAADEFISELPDGYNTIIGKNGFTLSGGQRQRISIARAMLKNSPILLLDEATSALDSISEKKIQAALEHLMQGRTTIVIAHRLSTIENSDIIYVLKKGEIVESGSHKELIKKAGEYNKLHKGMEAIGDLQSEAKKKNTKK